MITSPNAQLISVNISTPLASVDAITVASAGYPNFIPAVRVYAGRLTGTTILAGDGKAWSTYGVVDHLGLPVGTWKMADQAGWLMSGPSIMGNGQHTAALTFTVSGETKPRKIVHVDGSVAYLRPEAAEDEPPAPSIVASSLEFALNAESHFGKKARQESTSERITDPDH